LLRGKDKKEQRVCVLKSKGEGQREGEWREEKFERGMSGRWKGFLTTKVSGRDAPKLRCRTARQEDSQADSQASRVCGLKKSPWGGGFVESARSDWSFAGWVAGSQGGLQKTEHARAGG
jgi:hypothetical protein